MIRHLDASDGRAQLTAGFQLKLQRQVDRPLQGRAHAVDGDLPMVAVRGDQFHAALQLRFEVRLPRHVDIIGPFGELLVVQTLEDRILFGIAVKLLLTHLEKTVLISNQATMHRSRSSSSLRSYERV